MMLLEKIKYFATNTPDKTAMIVSSRLISYKDFYKNIIKCANYLKKETVAKGDIIIFENTQDEFFCYIFFAINLLNAIALPIDKSNAYKVNEIKKRVNAKIVVSIEDIKENLEKSSKQKIEITATMDDSCLLLLSSGSTGYEKVIEYSNDSVYHIVQVYPDIYNIDANFTVLPTGPLCRAYSITRMFLAFYYGMSLCIFDSQNVIDLLNLCSKYKHILLSTNPTMIHYLITLFGEKFSSCLNNIEIIESCTAPLNSNDAKILASMLKNTKFYNFYGATEYQIAYLDILKYGYKKGCVGELLESTVVEILDDEGNIINSNKNHPGVIRIYNEEYGFKYFKEDQQKYFYPGEIGYIENELLYLVDREKNFFNINGYKTSPTEIEDLVLTFPGVLECICYYKGVLSLDIVVNNNFDISKLRIYLRNHLYKYQIPKKINIVTSIAKTSNGKLNRRVYN